MTDEGITFPDGKATTEPTLRHPDGESVSTATSDAQAAIAAIDWDARLQAAVEATIAERDRRRNERAEFARRRNWGVEQRHKTKLNRVANTGPSLATPQLTEPSPVGETGTEQPQNDKRGSAQ
jgi:hypothetical protein